MLMTKNFASFLDEIQGIRFRISLLEVWLRDRSQSEYIPETDEIRMCTVDKKALESLSECEMKLFDEIYLPLKQSAIE